MNNIARRFALLTAAAAAFGLSPLASALGPVAGSALFVTLGVLLALAASGAISAVTVAAGAVGAFAAGVLLPVSAPLAGAVLLTLCFAERSLRVRTTMARASHVGLAAIGGALASGLAAQYAAVDLTVRGVVVVVAAVLASIPLLIEADDAVAHSLDELAEEVPSPTRAELHEGAELRRNVDASMLERHDERQANKTWRALLNLAHARARLERTPRRKSDDRQRPAVVRRLDDKIAAHVAALARMYTAADEARAAEMSLDDGAMRSVEDKGESLEEMSRAIVQEAAADEV
jgi:hypothetical protein